MAVGAIILDDSHACLDEIQSSFTIKIPRNNNLYDKFLEIFENSLKHRGKELLKNLN